MCDTTNEITDHSIRFFDDRSMAFADLLSSWGIHPSPLSHEPSDFHELGWSDPWVNPDAPEHVPPF